jgi:hypothetical protein
MEKSYNSLKVLLKVFKFSAVSRGSSTRSVVMTFLYPGPPLVSHGDSSRTQRYLRAVVAGHLQVHNVVNILHPDLGSQPRADKRVPVPSVGAASGVLTCSPPPASASSCRSSGGGKSGGVASASGASSVGTGSPGADGSEAAAAGAGSAPEGSARVDGPGAAVAVPGSS